MTDIGRAGIVLKGDYNSAATYETLDAVSFNNALYVAKQNVPAGTTPANTAYWQCAVNGALVNAPTNILINEEFEATTSLAYTGISFTIPAGAHYCVQVAAVFSNSIPYEILVSEGSATDAPYFVHARSTDAMHVTIGGYAYESITFYVSAKYQTSATNRIVVAGWYL